VGTDQLSEWERDALKEMANIGSGHAASAMSRLLDRNIIIHAPRILSGVLHCLASQLYETHAHVAAVLLNFSGDITGKALIAFRQKAVEKLLDMLLASNNSTDKAVYDSLVKEIANILFCSYLNALGDLLNFTIIPSVPTMVAKLDYELPANTSLPWLNSDEMTFGIETEFFFTEENQLFKALLFIVPDAASVRSILQALKVPEQ
jgi:chemotaxis protein CheC